jgi:outer membrane protein OmpA-like peptidoglycan-associated protein
VLPTPPIPNPDSNGVSTISASRETTSSENEHLPVLPTMIPPPLRSDLSAADGRESEETRVAHPHLGPSALASPVGVEGVMHAKRPEPARAETPKPPAKTSAPEAIAATVPAHESNEGKTAALPPELSAAPVPPPSAAAADATTAPESREPAVSMTPPELAGSMWGAVDAKDLPPPPPDLPLPSAEGPGTKPAQATKTSAASESAASHRSPDSEHPARVAAVEPPPQRTVAPAIGAPTVGAKRLEVEFPSDSAALDNSARETIRKAAEAYRNDGRRIRIVGHAAGGTADRATDDHMLANFEMSLKRATAVSNELIRLGVDPGSIVVEAVGDRSADGTPGAISEARSHSADIYLE